jgi:hypothetical protein
MIRPHRFFFVYLGALIGLFGPVVAVAADVAQVAEGQDAPAEHPLMPALRLAYEIRAHINRTVQDYSCILIKRERVDERLRDYQYLYAKIRQQQIRDGRVVTPLSVYLYFLRPARLRGREVLYVAGQNDGQLIARRGGSRFSYVTVTLDPRGERAMDGNRYAITEIGIKNLVNRLIEAAEDEIEHYPRSEECQVTFFDQAKIADRECRAIEVSYPVRRKYRRFQTVRVFIDKELRVPIRYEAYDFPGMEGEAPKLLEQYTYLNLKLNIGLTDSDFLRSRLGSLFH